MNPMKQIQLEKITVNMGAGDDPQRVEASQKVLELLSGKKVVVTRNKNRTTFGAARGRAHGVKVTVRKQAAEELLKRLLTGAEGKLLIRQFDTHGNFSFGIPEYIHIPGMNYDPDIGILGLEVAVTLKRPGYRVKERRIRPGKIGKKHIVSPDEARDWARNFGFTLLEKPEETVY